LPEATMNERQDRHICPECGTPMEAGETVASCGHLSRWWKCPNKSCGTSWLVPVPAVEVEAVLTQITQSSLDGWLNDRSVGHLNHHISMTRG